MSREENDDGPAEPVMDATATREALLEIVYRARSVPHLDRRSADEILGYDADGLPS